MITVREILERKGKQVNIIRPDTMVFDALAMLEDLNMSYLLVMDNNEFRGIFCERDYCRNVILKGRNSRETTVQDVMTVDVPVVKLSDSAESCMNTMTLHKTRYLLAYDEEGFRAVITIHDLLRQVLASKESVFDHEVAGRLLDYDEGGKVY